MALTRPRDTADKLETFAGEPVVLEIEVSRPNAQVKWLVNGGEIRQSSNVTITEDGLVRRLTIHSPSPEDSGRYTCDAADDRIDFQVKVSGEMQQCEFFFFLACRDVLKTKRAILRPQSNR